LFNQVLFKKQVLIDCRGMFQKALGQQEQLDNIKQKTQKPTQDFKK